MTACVMMVPILQFADQNGAPLVGGKLYTYLAGSTTPQPLYNNVSLAMGTEYSNPIILDASGTIGGPAYTASVSYKYVLTDANDVPMWTADNIAAVASV